jgi:hypothetical protein
MSQASSSSTHQFESISMHQCELLQDCVVALSQNDSDIEQAKKCLSNLEGHLKHNERIGRWTTSSLLYTSLEEEGSVHQSPRVSKDPTAAGSGPHDPLGLTSVIPSKRSRPTSSSSETAVTEVQSSHTASFPIIYWRMCAIDDTRHNTAAPPDNEIEGGMVPASKTLIPAGQGRDIRRRAKRDRWANGKCIARIHKSYTNTNQQ